MKAPGSLFRFLGGRPTPTPEKPTKDEVRLYLTAGPGRLLIGRLWRDGDDLVFAYSDEFLARPEVPTLPDFPRREKREYRSRTLWPFFMARLPPTERPDVQAAVRRRNIEPQDAIEVLGQLSKRSISSPYELELAHAG